jgi:hypothetical protein
MKELHAGVRPAGDAERQGESVLAERRAVEGDQNRADHRNLPLF